MKRFAHPGLFTALRPAVALAAFLAFAASAARAQTFLYWDLNSTTAGSGGGSTPSGAWTNSDIRWNPTADGTGIPFPWINNAVAVFSAGTNATGTYTVSLGTASGMSASGLLVQDGTVTLGGTGTLTMVNPLPGIAPYLSHGNASVTIGSGVTLAGLAGFTFGGSGSGSVTLNGSTTVAATTTIDGTTVHLGAAERLSDVSLVSLASDGVLDLANFNETIGGLGGSGSVTLGSGNLTIAQLSDAAFSGTISGTGSVTKAGAFALTLTKPAGWSGGTAITNGSLALGASNLLPDSTVLPISASGTFLVGLNSEKIAGLSGSGTVTLSGGALELGGSTGYNFNGSIVGSGQLVKSGAATFILNGAGTWLGTASIQGGTLRLGGHERLNNLLDVTVAAGATLDVNGVTETIDALTGAGSVTLEGGTLSLGSNHAIFTLDAAVTGPGTLMKSGTGVLTLGGTFGPSGTLSLFQGSVLLGAADRVGDNVDVFLNAGTLLALGGFNETVHSLSGLGNVSLGAGTLTVASDGDSTFGGAIQGSGGLTKNGDGTLELMGASTYTGTTHVNDGELRLDGEGRLAYGTNAVVASGAAIRLSAVDGDGSQYFDTVTGAGDLTSSSIYSTTFGLGVNGSSWTFAGRLRGTASFAKLGGGTLTLTGASDFGGDFDIIAGTVKLGGDNRVSTSQYAEVNLAPGGTLDLNGFAQSLARIEGFGTVDLGLGGDLTLIPTATSEFSGTLSGFGSLTKLGAATYTLSGPLTFSGPTTITTGRLRLAHSGTVDTDVDVAAVAHFDVTDREVTIDQLTGAGDVTLGGGQLVVGGGGGNFSFSGDIAGGTGSRFVKNGGGTLLAGGHSSAGLTVVQAGTLFVGLTDAFDHASSIHVQTGAQLSLLHHDTTISALTGGGGVLLGGAAFSVGSHGPSFTFPGTIEGPGALTKVGNGNFTLSGTVSEVASFALTDGTLTLGGDERLPASLNLATTNGATFDLVGFDETIGLLSGDGIVKLPATSRLTVQGNAAAVFAGSFEGTGAFAKKGTGVFTFSGKSNGAAEFSVADGRLLLAANDRFDPKSHLVVDAPGTFDADTFQQEFDLLAGDGAVRVEGAGRVRVAQGLFTGSLQGTGLLEKFGATPFVLEQPQNTTVKLRVAAGHLQLANAGAWTFGDIVLASGGTLSTVGAATVNAPLANAGAFQSNGTTTLTGAVSGAGSFTGDFTLQGSFAPGAGNGQFALVAFHGGVTLAASHTLHLELGGTTSGTQHDALAIDDDLNLGGTLRLSLAGGFTPAAGQLFQVLSADHLHGNFANYDLPALAHGLAWDTSRLRVDGTLRVLSGYAAFVAAAGLDINTDGAPLANPSGDGIANVMKYLLGGDPRVSQPNLLPIATVETSGGSTVLVFAYTVDALAVLNVSSQSVELSTDLQTWSPVLSGSNGVTLGVTPAGDYTHLVYRIPIAGPRAVARLRVML